MSVQTLTVQGVPAVRTHIGFTDKNLGVQGGNKTVELQCGGPAQNTGNIEQTLTVDFSNVTNCQVSNPKLKLSSGPVFSSNTAVIPAGDQVQLFVTVTTPAMAVGSDDLQASFTVDEVWS